jgi:FHS family glucose/mannose:H+ symporter-like MFS transporter
MYKRKLLFWSACFGMFFFGICLITLGSVVPGLKEKYQLDELSSGTLFSIMPFGILAGSLIFGPLCDKYGYKILLSLSCFCMFAAFEGIGFAPSRAILHLSIFLFGLGGGAINGATNALVADISVKSKSANLSLLGVAFGLGAMGMPLLLGILEGKFKYDIILLLVGVAAFVGGIFFLLIRFPPPKQASGFPLKHGMNLIKDKLLVLVAFFLFCQSSFEAIISNWTTTFLSKELSVLPAKALYALTLFVAGMTIMRLLLGSILRNIPLAKTLITSFTIILLGLILLAAVKSFTTSLAGLFLLGAGLAAGFPVMLGLVGNYYRELSGTAFSFVLVVALGGNILINYFMGIIAQSYGIYHLVTVAFGELVVMIALSGLILKNVQKNKY